MSEDAPVFLPTPPEELPLEPEPPATPPEPCLVLIGRFQPFHRGHAALIDAALAHASTTVVTSDSGDGNSSDGRLRIGIGSSNRMESIENPWTWEEREQMLRIWLESAYPDADVDIVAIPDIDDPPNWVSHASRYHGEAGQLFTSDERTTELYAAAGWPTISSPLEARESWEGWRIRGTLRMLSTVSDREPAIEVMSVTIPRSVSEFLYDEGLLHRLAYHSTGGEPVG